MQPCRKNSDAIICKVAFGFRIYRESMNITDLPEGPYTIARYNRRNRIVLNGSCAHASAAAVQTRVPAGIELTLVTHDDGSREITKTGTLHPHAVSKAKATIISATKRRRMQPPVKTESRIARSTRLN